MESGTYHSYEEEVEKSVPGAPSIIDYKEKLEDRTRDLVEAQKKLKNLVNKSDCHKIPMFLAGAVFGAVMISWFLNTKDFLSRVRVNRPTPRRRRSGRFSRQSRRRLRK
tara:strand:+ start:365 stop:691 length:327 start_codon:yes stop_codon:yes gene_type:complete